MQRISVTPAGQITIPEDVRHELGIHSGSQVTLDLKGDHLELRLDDTGAAPQRSMPMPASGFGMIKSGRKPVPADFDVASLASD